MTASLTQYINCFWHNNKPLFRPSIFGVSFVAIAIVIAVIGRQFGGHRAKREKNALDRKREIIDVDENKKKAKLSDYHLLNAKCATVAIYTVRFDRNALDLDHKMQSRNKKRYREMEWARDWSIRFGHCSNVTCCASHSHKVQASRGEMWNKQRK